MQKIQFVFACAMLGSAVIILQREAVYVVTHPYTDDALCALWSEICIGRLQKYFNKCEN